MPDPFELALASPSAKIDLDRENSPTATARVDVTSRLGRSTRVGVAAVTTPEAAPLTCTADPAEFHLADGATQSVDLTFDVGDTDQDTEVEVVLRAYAVDDPQGSWAASPSLTVSVNRIASFPMWIVAVVAVALLAVVGGVVALLAGGGGSIVVDVVGSELASARSALAAAGFEDDAVMVHEIGDAGETDGCVLFQTPPAGATADAVDLLVVTCPEPGVHVEHPLAGGDVCEQSPDFCAALREDVDESTPSEEVLADQVDSFLEIWTIEGTVVPSVIGFELDQARTVAQAGELGFEEVTVDGVPDEDDRCVLYQHPLVDTLQAPGYTLTVVTAACPTVREQPDQVEIVPAVLADPADACSYLAALCAVEGLTSADLEASFEDYQLAFRERFSAPLVPDLVGDFFYTLRKQLADRGLTLEVTNDDLDPAVDDCRMVVNQTPGAGLLAADVTDGIVEVTLEAKGRPRGDTSDLERRLRCIILRKKLPTRFIETSPSIETSPR